METINLLEQAAMHFQKNEFDRVSECLDAVLQIDPSNEDALLGMASVNDALGRESCNNGDYKQAIIYFSKAIEYDPEDEYANKWLSKLKRPVAIEIYIPAEEKDEHSFYLVKVAGHEPFEILKGEKKSINCLPGEHKVFIKTQSSNYATSFFVPVSKKIQIYKINCSDGQLQILHVLDNITVGYSSKAEESNPVLFENSKANSSTKHKRKKIAKTLIISGVLTFLAVLSVLLVKYSPSSIRHSDIESLSTMIANESWDDAYIYATNHLKNFTYFDDEYDEWYSLLREIAVAKATLLCNAGDFDGAYRIFDDINVALDYSIPICCDIMYAQAKQTFEKGDYKLAMDQLENLIEYDYQDAISLYEEALNNELGTYKSDINYYDLLYQPDNFLNQKMLIYGRILEIIEAEDGIMLAIAVLGNNENLLLAGYSSDLPQLLLSADDFVGLYGQFTGFYTFEVSYYGNMSVPVISVQYIDQ